MSEKIIMLDNKKYTFKFNQEEIENAVCKECRHGKWKIEYGISQAGFNTDPDYELWKFKLIGPCDDIQSSDHKCDAFYCEKDPDCDEEEEVEEEPVKLKHI